LAGTAQQFSWDGMKSSCHWGIRSTLGFRAMMISSVTNEIAVKNQKNFPTDRNNPTDKKS
jgi:hypothetical protein